jgi:Spy/CpxP family protein refolding chaperone
MSTRKTVQTATLAFAIATALVATSATAGPDARGYDQGPAAFAETRIERMTERLDLTPEQQVEIRTILEEQRALADQQRQETRARIGAVLTPEQLARIDERRQVRMERHLDRLAHRLDLSADQVERVRAIMQAKAEDRDMARAEVREQIRTVLTEEQLSAFDAKVARFGRGGPGSRCAPGNPRGGPAY